MGRHEFGAFDDDSDTTEGYLPKDTTEESSGNSRKGRLRGFLLRPFQRKKGRQVTGPAPRRPDEDESDEQKKKTEKAKNGRK